MAATDRTTGRRSNELGPAGHRVARAVYDLRRSADITTRELSERLDSVGRPVLPTGVTKIEAGTRRVDADDLVALAVTLGTTPTRLLMPSTARPGTEAPLTADVSDTEQVLWAWADGRVPLTRDLGDTGPGGMRPAERVAEVTTAFRRRSRPDTPREQLPGIEQHYAAVQAVADTVREHAGRELPPLVLLDLVRVAMFGTRDEDEERA